MISHLGFLQWRLFAGVFASVFNVALLAACFGYLWSARKHHGWREAFGNQLALGITLHMLGESMRSTWAAGLLWEFAQGVDIGNLETIYPVAFIGQLISAAGILWKFRNLSPAWCARWLWIVVMIAAFGSGWLAVTSAGMELALAGVRAAYY